MSAGETPAAPHSAGEGLREAVNLLRAECNDRIAAASRAAYRQGPNGPVVNPPVPFYVVNRLLKRCDAVFAASDAGSTTRSGGEGGDAYDRLERWLDENYYPGARDDLRTVARIPTTASPDASPDSGEAIRIAAREAAASVRPNSPWAKNVLAGRRDEDDAVRSALAALARPSPSPAIVNEAGEVVPRVPGRQDQPLHLRWSDNGTAIRRWGNEPFADSRTYYPATCLETAACVWEAVLDMEQERAEGGDEGRIGRAIAAAREAMGSSHLRLTCLGWVDAIDAAWRVADVDEDNPRGGAYPRSFDWEFVPEWIATNVDWSDPSGPKVRS